ncbi:DUF2244 domain-containing protein [Frigidibacter oleivorans]|uniref:DUF2244 domain-containing protein n=1 Tax=Frigidibacter oleivorans TaxID=2487129 RepID=UPI000F8E2DFC|nr:DUF2244 domain-containing protein [Frigidibacter oleivorans]
MPYEWISEDGESRRRLHLWPYRSLPKRGFVAFIGGTALLLCVPLSPVIGSAALWVVLPFLLAALGGIWWALDRSYRDGEIVEDLRLSSDLISLTRTGPRGRRQHWQANAYWVSLHLHPTGGPVPDYLTLKGAGREVEIGAFLAQEERLALHGELRAALAGLR